MGLALGMMFVSWAQGKQEVGVVLLGHARMLGVESQLPLKIIVGLL